MVHLSDCPNSLVNLSLSDWNKKTHHFVTLESFSPTAYPRATQS